ncbi:MAG: glycoside hydrolase family 3 N-terminal domain-containing protein [Cyanobacteria bacterium J06635_1]
MKPFLPDLDDLSLTEQVAQMVVVRTTGHLFEHEIEYPQWEATADDLRHWLGELGIGGVILLGGSAAEVGLRSQQLQSWAKYPLLLAADIEEGVGQRFSGATWFPPPMALAALAKTDLPLALDYAEQMGRCTAQEASAIGLNWLLAPVVDVNNNPANPVINVRAFGDNAAIVNQLATAFIRGAQAWPVLTTAKHFPGHGDTTVDSHLALPVVPHRFERLQQLELVPFGGAIAANVDSVMTAHLSLTALDTEYPATLSKATLTGLLRQDLGFDGIIVTDALVMGAITQQYGPFEAAALAVEAGADVLLMPADPLGAIETICEAVRTGRISSAQIRASVERIWRGKYKTGLTDGAPSCHAWEHDILPPVQVEQIAQPSARALQQAVLQATHQQRGKLQTAATSQPQHNLILVDDLVGCRYLPRTAPAITLPSQQGYQTYLVDGRWTGTAGLPQGQAPTLLQLFIRGNPFRSSANLTELAQGYIDVLLAANRLQAVVVYGSPYVFDQLCQSLSVPCGFSYGQMPEAQTVALRSLFAIEKAPVGATDATFTD